jgi:KDO2-lipid IV(A) lauroyltransferase
MKISLSRLFQTRLNVMLFRHLPPVFTYHLMLTFGRVYYLFKRSERRLIESNIRDMLGRKHGEDWVQHKIREAFRGIFLHYFEKLFAAFRSYDCIRRFVNRHFEVEGIEIVDSALRSGNGAILATAHYGAVEFIPWVLALRSYPLDVILECATHRLREAFNEKTKYVDVRLYTLEDGRGVFYRALETLKGNRLLMTECDEVDTWHRRESRRIRLFDKELYFDSTLNLLARRSGAPVIGAFLERTGFMSYRLTLEDVSLQRETDNVARDTLTLWEKYVNRHPEQWYQWKKWGDMKVAS